MMNSQIESVIYQQEQYYNQLSEDLTNFCNDNGYDWTLSEIIKQYRMFKKTGCNTITARIVIDKFKERLERLIK